MSNTKYKKVKSAAIKLEEEKIEIEIANQVSIFETYISKNIVNTLCIYPKWSTNPIAVMGKEWPGKTNYSNFDSIFGDFFLNFLSKAHIFWGGHKILRNLDCMHCSQKLGEDFAKFCGLLRIYEL